MSRRHTRALRTRGIFPRQLWFVAFCATVVPAVLLISGLREHTTRVFANSVPAITPLRTLTPGKRVCEGPVMPQGAFRTAVFMNSGANAKALVTVHAGRSTAAPIVALGTLETITPQEGENAVLLSQAVSTSRLTFCVREQHGSMTLYGGSSGYGTPVIVGARSPATLWLQLLSAGPHRFLGSLRLAFRRAALFRPGWVGAWTFWGVSLFLFVGFPAIVLGVRFALEDDTGSSEGDGDGS